MVTQWFKASSILVELILRKNSSAQKITSYMPSQTFYGLRDCKN